jgi:hypothetical protein
MRFLLAIFLSFIIFLFDHCSICSCKQVPCPAFSDNNFSQWFPYSNGDTVIFQSSSEFDTIRFSGIEKSSSYDASRGCYNGSSGCTANCHIVSNEIFGSYNRKFQVSISIITPFGSTNPTRLVSFNLYGFSSQANNIADTGLVASSFPSKYFTTLNIGNKIYDNVQVIQQDTAGTTNYAGPYKIYLEKNQGMIAYENYPDLKLWIKR